MLWLLVLHIYTVTDFSVWKRSFTITQKLSNLKTYMAKIITGTMSAGDKQQQKLQVIKP